MWKDSETEIDYLDFSYIVEIMKDTINDEKLLPSCIGLYGDWGSGKSSLMHMCKKQLEEQKDGTVCLLFNGWLYESYDDAKTAILASILDGIKECRELSGAAKITLKALYDSIDKFKVIKGGIKFGIDMAVTGGLGAITNLAIKEITKKAKKVAEDVDEETMLQAIKDKLDYKEVREDIREFREKFAELIEEAGIKKLVIFVDELDRCNPATILDTLEAMRLFLFSGNVSFVIGADERHVTYAIRSKFDDIEGINMDIGKEYQEKLIQYPIRIPYTEKCVISFVDIYPKNKKNMDGLSSYELNDDELREFAEKLSKIAADNNIKIGSCAEKIDLDECGIIHNCCIDRELIEKIIGCKLNVGKDKNQRKECGCVESVEIGTYNTCKNGCAYCYANYSSKSVETNAAKYDPSSPLLCGQVQEDDKITIRKGESLKETQLSIFDM